MLSLKKENHQKMLAVWIEEKDLELFKKLCLKNKTTVALEIRAYIKKVLGEKK